MGLPQRVFYPVHETAARWGCTVSDIAGWAAMGMLKFVTGIPPIACDDVRIAGLVQIEPADILPMFRRCGTGPQEAHLRRVRQLEGEDWLYITAPEEGVPVSVGDLMILGQEVQRFEDVNNLFGRVAEGAGLGDNARMPNSLGGIRMAIRVAELARAGITPDWMPGVVPRCVPVDMKRNRHGDRAVSVVVGTERILVSGKWRTIEVRACPVTWRPHPEQIASARRGYEDWWQALDWVRDGMVAARMLRNVEVTAAMPKVRPWGSG